MMRAYVLQGERVLWLLSVTKSHLLRSANRTSLVRLGIALLGL
jgi:hypothetical protein